MNFFFSLTKEEKRISPENQLKNKFEVTWVKIFLVTPICGNKSIFIWCKIVLQQKSTKLIRVKLYKNN